MTDAKDLVGEAGVKALTDAGFTITPPRPEPARLVTLEESKERYVMVMTSKLEWSQENARDTWARLGPIQDAYNAADDWLVKTVNRRITDGLPSSYWRPKSLLLDHYCGEPPRP